MFRMLQDRRCANRFPAAITSKPILFYHGLQGIYRVTNGEVAPTCPNLSQPVPATEKWLFQCRTYDLNVDATIDVESHPHPIMSFSCV
jgi:hypothetical protein